MAQKIAGLPLYSGVGYRFICFAVFYVITNIYLIRYALKIQKHPELSPMYEIDKTSEFRNAADLDSFGKLDARKILICWSSSHPLSSSSTAASSSTGIC